MIPLKDENPSRTIPYVTVSLVALNVLVYLYQWTLGPEPETRFVLQFGVIPYEITHFQYVGAVTKFSPVPRYLTPLTAMFVHGGLLHLAGNMLYLWIFGNNVEDALGHGRFMLFYLASGLAASAVHILVYPDSTMPIIGASGAIAGVLGAYFLMYPRARVTTLVFVFIIIRLVKIPAGLLLGAWLVLQMVSAASSQPGVAWFAHIGGFLTGIVLLVFILGRRSPSVRYRG